jgi:trigger factor
MNITQEQTGNLTAELKIEILQEDYQSKVDKAIRDYQKKASIPGFRPGKVPMGMVKKMVGSEVLADELNKLISDSLFGYLEENKIEIFGEPIANTDKQQELQDSVGGRFEFYFDLALKPVIDFSFDQSLKVPFYDVEVTEVEIDEMAARYREKGAKEEDVETSEVNDSVMLSFTELDVEGNDKPEGLQISTHLKIDSKIKDDFRSLFVGLNSGSEIVISPTEVFADEQTVRSLLELDKEALLPDSRFKCHIYSIKRSIPAELNQAFFSEVFPEDNISDEASFREKIKSLFKEYRHQDASIVFYRTTMKAIIDHLNIELPDELLKKRLIETARREKYNEEELLSEYPIYAKTLKEQVVESYLAEKYEIKVEYPEVREEVLRSYGIPPIPNPTEDIQKSLDNMVSRALGDEKQAVRFYEMVYKRKLTALFLEKVDKEYKNVSLDEFLHLEQESR